MAWFCAGEKRKSAPEKEGFLEYLQNPILTIYGLSKARSPL